MIEDQQGPSVVLYSMQITIRVVLSGGHHIHTQSVASP